MSFRDVMARLVACAVLVTACVLAGLYIFSDKATDRGFIRIASMEKGRSDGEQMLLPSKTSKLPEEQQPFDPLTGMVITNSSNVTTTPPGPRGWASGTRFSSEPTCLTHAVYSVPPISCTASFAATPILAKLPKGKQLQVRWAFRRALRQNPSSFARTHGLQAASSHHGCFGPTLAGAVSCVL